MNKIAFLFPGQGSQYIGMGKSLCKQFSIAKETFKEANDVLGFDLQKLCFRGPFNDLAKTQNAQPAILTTSVAAFRVLMQKIEIEPDFLVGHSLGELTALTCSEAINFSDAVKIARARGKIAQKIVSQKNSAMTAVSKIDKKIIEKVCKNVSVENKKVVIAVINSPKQIVISGDKESVKRAEKALSKIGARLKSLKISAPFHSPLLKNAAKKMKEELPKFKFKQLKWPVLSGVIARPYKNSNEIIDNLNLHFTRPIQWLECINYLKNQKVSTAIEIGPKTILKNLMKEITKKIKVYPFQKPKDLEFLKKEFNMDKKTKYNIIINCLKIAICAKNKNWNNKEYQKNVVEPYRKIKQMLSNLENNNIEPSLQNIVASFKMLQSVLLTKKTSIQERKERYNEIFNSNINCRYLLEKYQNE